jgi:PEP-CTERM motif
MVYRAVLAIARYSFTCKGRNMLKKVLVLSSVALIAGLAMPAFAAVPDAEGRYRLAADGDYIDSTPFSTVPFFASDAFTTISVLGQSQPSISIVSVRGSPRRQSNGEALLSYSFRYQAADAEAYDALLNANAFINFAGVSTITDTWTGSEGFFSSGRTTVKVQGNDFPMTYVDYRCGNFRSDIDGCGTQTFSFDLDAGNFADAATFSLFGTVRLSAFSENGGDGVQVDQSSAFIDPIITLSGTGLDLSRYSLQLSSGVGNGAPVIGGVPEPTSWALMIAGFGIVGGALRRKPRSEAAVS